MGIIAKLSKLSGLPRTEVKTLLLLVGSFVVMTSLYVFAGPVAMMVGLGVVCATSWVIAQKADRR